MRNFSRTGVEDDKEKGEAVRNQLGTSIDNLSLPERYFMFIVTRKIMWQIETANFFQDCMTVY